MENLTVNFQLPAAAGFCPAKCWTTDTAIITAATNNTKNNDIDYADYSTDHRDNNYRNFEKKKRKKTQKEIVADILKRWD